MKKINYLLLLSIALIITSCCDDDYWDDDHHSHKITGKGDIKTKSIPRSGFTGIDLRQVANVNISTGRSFYVDFTAYENILEYMDAQVVNNILIINFNRDIEVESDEDIRIDISMPEINNVYLKGVGDIYIHGPEQDQLNIIIDGVGSVEAFSLPVKNADILVNGKGNVEVSVSDYLDVIINGIGNVYYKGKPSITKKINGIGEMIRD